MFRRSLAPVAFAVLASVGCVPVTEPVGDIDKAERDKALVGTWTVTKSKGLAAMLNIESLTVDAPDVKGNPKGLMLAGTNGSDPDLGFFTATVGKHTYATVFVGTGDNEKAPTFHKEGEYAKWKKELKKQFFVFRYTLDGDALTMDCGNLETFTKLMSDAKFEGDGRKHIQHFATPAGWLDKYLAKTGPDKVFDGTNILVLKREKK